MARAIKPKVRKKLLHTWVNERENQVVEKMAELDGVSLSEALRDCIREVASRRGLWHNWRDSEENQQDTNPV